MKNLKEYQDVPNFDQVKDTLEVLDFGFKMQVAITESLSDGKINIFDLPNVFKPMSAANAAIQGFQNVKTELKNLTPEGKVIVHAFVQDRFDLVHDELEAVIEETIDLVVGTISTAFKWLDYQRPGLTV
jgi:hypothetical protein